MNAKRLLSTSAISLALGVLTAATTHAVNVSGGSGGANSAATIALPPSLPYAVIKLPAGYTPRQ